MFDAEHPNDDNQERPEREIKLVNFRGAQILQSEANVLQKILKWAFIQKINGFLEFIE